MNDKLPLSDDTLQHTLRFFSGKALAALAPTNRRFHKLSLNKALTVGALAQSSREEIAELALNSKRHLQLIVQSPQLRDKISPITLIAAGLQSTLSDEKSTYAISDLDLLLDLPPVWLIKLGELSPQLADYMLSEKEIRDKFFKPFSNIVKLCKRNETLLIKEFEKVKYQLASSDLEYAARSSKKIADTICYSPVLDWKLSLSHWVSIGRNHPHIALNLIRTPETSGEISGDQLNYLSRSDISITREILKNNALKCGFINDSNDCQDLLPDLMLERLWKESSPDSRKLFTHYGEIALPIVSNKALWETFTNSDLLSFAQHPKVNHKILSTEALWKKLAINDLIQLICQSDDLNLAKKILSNPDVKEKIASAEGICLEIDPFNANPDAFNPEIAWEVYQDPLIKTKLNNASLLILGMGNHKVAERIVSNPEQLKELVERENALLTRLLEKYSDIAISFSEKLNTFNGSTQSSSKGIIIRLLEYNLNLALHINKHEQLKNDIIDSLEGETKTLLRTMSSWIDQVHQGLTSQQDVNNQSYMEQTPTPSMKL